MIRFRAKFMVYDSPKIGVPKELRYNQDFRCSFSIEIQELVCRIIYLGYDETMNQKTWYEGIIELPYAERHPPFNQTYESRMLLKKEKDIRNLLFRKKLYEPILLDKNYSIKVGKEIIGECILCDVIEIVANKYLDRQKE
jgi:hypothetical protein